LVLEIHSTGLEFAHPIARFAKTGRKEVSGKARPLKMFWTPETSGRRTIYIRKINREEAASSIKEKMNTRKVLHQREAQDSWSGTGREGGRSGYLGSRVSSMREKGTSKSVRSRSWRGVSGEYSIWKDGEA